MRKHLSVFMLYARSSLFRVLLIFILMAVLELVLFYFAVERVMVSESIGLERMINKSCVGLVMGAAFIAMSAQLSIMGCEYVSKQSYTLRRLSVSEGSVFAWQALFNTLMYLLLWGVQLGLVLIMCAYGVEKMGALASNQATFLAFYRSQFLHSLLPLGEWTRYLRNIILIIALGLASALFSYNQRRKKLGLAMIFMLPLTALPFAGKTGNLETDVVQILASLCVIIWSIYKVCAKEAAEQNEET